MGPKRTDIEPAAQTVDRRGGPGIGSPLRAHCIKEPLADEQQMAAVEASKTPWSLSQALSTPKIVAQTTQSGLFLSHFLPGALHPGSDSRRSLASASSHYVATCPSAAVQPGLTRQKWDPSSWALTLRHSRRFLSLSTGPIQTAHFRKNTDMVLGPGCVPYQVSRCVQLVGLQLNGKLFLFADNTSILLR